MSEALLVVVAGGTVLSLLGWAVLAPVEADLRARLFPAAPLLGAALVTVCLSWTSWFATAGVGTVATFAVAAGLVGWGVVRGQRPWRLPRAALVGALVAVACSAAACVVALLPTHWTGDGAAVMPNGSHDIYYYAAEAAWLQDHDIHPAPVVGAAPGEATATPAYGPMAATLDAPLRFGQPTVIAVLSTVLGLDPVDAVTPLTGLWVLLVGPAAFVAMRMLGRGPVAAAVAAVLCSSITAVVHQAYSQNLDSLLGIGLGLLALGVLLTAADGRAGRWLPALCLAGLVGVYTEYSVFVAPTLAGHVLLRRRPQLAGMLARMLVVLGLAVLLSPSLFWRGVQTLLVGRSSTWPSPFFTDGWLPALTRAVGAAPIELSGDLGTADVLVALLLVGVLVTGLGCAVRLSPHGRGWLLLVLVAVALVGLQTLSRNGYSQYRSVLLCLPLLVFVAVLGWSCAARPYARIVGRRAAHRHRLAVAVPLALVTLVTLGTAGLNLQTASASVDAETARARHLDSTYAEAARWVRGHGGPEGEDVSVVVPDMVSQLWIAYALREETAVSYVSLRRDYLAADSYWDGEVDPFVLLGPGAHLLGPEDAVVAENDRFRLVRMTPRSVVVTPLGLATWSPHAQEDGGMTGPDGGQVVVVTGSEAAREVTLQLAVPDRRRVSASDARGEETRTAVREGRAHLEVRTGGSATILTIDVGDDDTVSPATFTLLGVRNAE